jgi:hypothetical protein
MMRCPPELKTLFVYGGLFRHGKIWAHFFARGRAKKPGFPLQVLGFAQDAWASSDFAKAKLRPANANPVGFPLQSLARR